MYEKIRSEKNKCLKKKKVEYIIKGLIFEYYMNDAISTQMFADFTQICFSEAKTP